VRSHGLIRTELETARKGAQAAGPEGPAKGRVAVVVATVATGGRALYYRCICAHL